MASRSLGTLTADLILKMGGFTKGMDSAARETANFEKKVDASFRRIGSSFNRLAGLVGVGLGFEALRRTAAAAIEYGDEINKAAEKTGIGVETMSELAYAAKQTDIELTSLSTAFKKMQVTLSEAKSGSKEAVQDLAALGLTISDLKDLSPDQQFELLADRIAALKDPADKARAAVAFMGKAGADLLPLFARGAQGIRELREEAHRLGATLTEEQAQALADTDDAIKRLKASFSGLARTLTAEVAPGFSQVFDNLTAFLTGDATGKAVTKLRYQIEFLQEMQGRSFVSVGYGDIGTGFFTAAEGAEKLLELQQKLAQFEQPNGGRRTAGGPGQKPTAAPPGYLPEPEKLRTVASETDKARDRVQEFIQKLQDQAATFGLSEAAALRYSVTTGDLSRDLALLGTSAGPLREQLLSLSDALGQQQATAAIEEQIKALQDQAATLGLTDQQALAYSVTQGELAQTLALTGENASALASTLLEAGNRLAELQAQAKQNEERQSIFEATRTDAERYAETLDHLQELFRGASDQETYGRAVADAAGQYVDAADAAEEYRLVLEELNAQFAAGALSPEAHDAAVLRAKETFEKAGNELSVFWEQASRNTQDILSEFLLDPFKDGIGGLVDSFGDMLAKMAAQAVAADIAGKLFGEGGAGSGGGWIGTAAAWAKSYFGYDAGGYTGQGARLEPAGIVHRGEYVVPKRIVEEPGALGFLRQFHAYGMDLLDGLPGFAGGGLVPALATPQNLAGMAPKNVPRLSAARGMTVQNNFTIQAESGRVSAYTEAQIAAAAARGIARANARNN